MFTKNKKSILGVMLLLTSIFLCGMTDFQSASESTSSVRVIPVFPVSHAVTGQAVVTGQVIEVSQAQIPLSQKKPTLKDIYSKVKIKKVSLIRYTKKKVKIKQFPTKKAKTLGKIKKWQIVKIKGKIKGKLGRGYVLIKYKQKKKGCAKGYIKKESVMKTNPDVFYKWKGPKLTRSKGVNSGPSGKETYYNLPMGGVVRILQSHRIKGRYWVRKDGCKMWGKYIMIAADQRIRPLGSHVKTSLGMGVVADTGSFIYSNSHQIDIAVAW